MGGRNQSESVAELNRKWWPIWSGILTPTLEDGIHYVFVNIETGKIRVEPLPTLQ